MFFLFSLAISVSIAVIWLGLLSMFSLCNASATMSLSVSTVTATVTLRYTETIAAAIPAQNHGGSHPIYFPRDDGRDGNSSSDGSDSGIQINQMDLLSGIPALLLIMVGIVQLWPSTSDFCQDHVHEFLTWLKANIERDFSVTLFSCTGCCHTGSFDFSSNMIKRRIDADTGSSHTAHCTGNGHISVEEFIAIIQQKDSGSLVLELARIARYPKLKKLSMAIRILRFSSAFKNQVVFLQWLNIAMIYIFNWILRERLPDLLYWYSLSYANVFRRLFRMVPLEYSPRKSPDAKHDIADLAMYHVVNEHVPWIRYGIYHLLMSASGRQLTIKAKTENKGNADDDDLDEPDRFLSPCVILEENHIDIKHPMAKQCDLAIRMTSDQCSAARYLYSIALHSLRINLIGRHIGYPPPNVILSSFRTVKTSIERGQIVFEHQDLVVVFRDLCRYRFVKKYEEVLGIYSKYHSYQIYKSFVRILGSNLGNAITEQYFVHVLVNLTLYICPSKYVENSRLPAENNVDWDEFKMEGLFMETDLKKKLIRGHYKTCKDLANIIKNYADTNIYWGASMWQLYGLYDFWCQYLRQSISDTDSLHDSTWAAFMYLNKIIYMPYRIRQKTNVDKGDSENDYGIIKNIGRTGGNNSNGVSPYADADNSCGDDVNANDNDDWKKKVKVHRGDLVSVNFERDLNHDAYRNSVPAWCLCADRCRGICTLIVENCVMKIWKKFYFHVPYTFSMHKDFEGASILDNSCALVCLADQNMLLEFASRGTYFRRFEHKSVDEQPAPKLELVETSANSSRLLEAIIAQKYYITRRHKVIDKSQYLLSQLLYENADQIVAIFNGHIYCVGVRRNGSKLEWPEAQENNAIEYWEDVYEALMVNKATSLGLLQLPLYAQNDSAGSSSMLDSLAQDKFSKIRNIAEDGLLEGCDKLETICV